MAKGVKTSGRQKGTTNRVTGTTKEMISQIITRELQKLPTLLDQMEPKEKADCIFKLLSFIVPKINPVEEPKVKPLQNLHKFMVLKNNSISSQNKV